MSDFERRFDTGQTVTVMRPYGSDLAAVTSIARMTKRKIILSNGMEFTDRGQQWGFANEYGGMSLRQFREGDREKIKRQNLLRKMDHVKWHELSTDQLSNVHEIVSQK